jgi:glycerol-3-phosphate acyltransferase PlsY
MPLLIIVFIAAYMLGSIPFGLILVRATGRGDVRRIGSGSIGATNVLRTGSKGLAALTLLLDAGKGALAVSLAQAYVPGLVPAAAAGVVLGHVFPVWLKFRGGKGVATALGVLLTLAWPVGVGACITWLLFAICFRYSSLSSLAATAIAPLLAWYFTDPGTALLVVFVTGIVWVRHTSNMRRLIDHTEPKIGRKPATENVA